MSMVHYEPDTRVVPCLGCNELVADEDLVKLGRHWGTSTFLWHPYHFWCVRDEPPAPRSRLECVDCEERLSDEAIRAAAGWGATAERRLSFRAIPHKSFETRPREQPDGATPRPPGVRLVAVAFSVPALPLDTRADDQLQVILGNYLSLSTRRFEFVHDSCAKEASLLSGLRASSDRGALLQVYADTLEQGGDLARANFVRLSTQRRSARGELRQQLTRRLREARAALPSGWCGLIQGA